VLASVGLHNPVKIPSDGKPIVDNRIKVAR
jgi:hypothetical protein